MDPREELVKEYNEQILCMIDRIIDMDQVDKYMELAFHAIYYYLHDDNGRNMVEIEARIQMIKELEFALAKYPDIYKLDWNELVYQYPDIFRVYAPIFYKALKKMEERGWPNVSGPMMVGHLRTFMWDCERVMGMPTSEAP